MNRVGQVFERLTVQEQFGSRCVALCLCGRVITTSTYNLTSGRTRSCGCLQKELLSARSFRHGMHGSPTYVSWACMIQRVSNPSLDRASRYFERGILVDPRWKAFEFFLRQMGERPRDTTLDRINPDGHYFKENCRWADAETQARNKNQGTSDILGDFAEFAWHVPGALAHECPF